MAEERTGGPWPLWQIAVLGFVVVAVGISTLAVVVARLAGAGVPLFTFALCLLAFVVCAWIIGSFVVRRVRRAAAGARRR